MRNADTEHAREIRKDRAATLAGLRGRHDLAALLRSPPDCLWTCTVWKALNAVPGVGYTKARELCEASGVWPLAQIVELDDHKRASLCYRLENP